MKRRRLCIRVGPQEEALVQRLHVLLGGGGSRNFSETFREATVLLSALLLEQHLPPITYQRERRRRQQLLERLLRWAEALSSGAASPIVEDPPTRALPAIEPRQ